MTRKLLKQDDGGDKAPVGPIAHRSPKSETDIDPIAAEHAEAIRSLGKRVVTDVIEIGRRLTECKKIVGHGNWLPWLEHEFGWSDRQALNFTRVYELAETKSEKFSDLNLPVSSLYLLAAPRTPPKVRDEIIDRAEHGEKIKHGEIAERVRQSRPSSKRRPGGHIQMTSPPGPTPEHWRDTFRGEAAPNGEVLASIPGIGSPVLIDGPKPTTEAPTPEADEIDPGKDDQAIAPTIARFVALTASIKVIDGHSLGGEGAAECLDQIREALGPGLYRAARGPGAACRLARGRGIRTRNAGALGQDHERGRRMTDRPPAVAAMIPARTAREVERAWLLHDTRAPRYHPKLGGS